MPPKTPDRQLTLEARDALEPFETREKPNTVFVESVCFVGFRYLY